MVRVNRIESMYTIVLYCDCGVRGCMSYKLHCLNIVQALGILCKAHSTAMLLFTISRRDMLDHGKYGYINAHCPLLLRKAMNNLTHLTPVLPTPAGEYTTRHRSARTPLWG